jgi:CYTH domain
MAHSHTHQESHVTPAPISSHAERELKLAIEAGFRLPRLPGTPLPRRLLISTYYDTAAYDLAQARITLRHRIERGKQSWQLKIPLGDDRQEVEVADSQTNPPAALRELLLLPLGQRKLVPVVTLRVWRHGILVRHGRVPVAEVALDHVTVMKLPCAPSNSNCGTPVHQSTMAGLNSSARSHFQLPQDLLRLNRRHRWSTI